MTAPSAAELVEEAIKSLNSDSWLLTKVTKRGTVEMNLAAFKANSDLRERLIAAIRVLLAAAPPIPREPTEAMIDAGYRILGEPDNESPVRNAWRAMYDAALGAGDQQSAAMPSCVDPATAQEGMPERAQHTDGSAADPLIAEIDSFLSHRPYPDNDLLQRARDALAEQEKRLAAFRHTDLVYSNRIAVLERELAEAKKDAERLIDAGNGLIGLIQLVASRDDLPTGLDDLMLLSHRVTEAKAAIDAARGELHEQR